MTRDTNRQKSVSKFFLLKKMPINADRSVGYSSYMYKNSLATEQLMFLVVSLESINSCY